MPIDPYAPPATNIHERHIQASADLARRIAALERRPMLARAPWQDATLINGFTNVGGDYPPAGYYIDGLGRVRLRGRLSLTSAVPVPNALGRKSSSAAVYARGSVRLPAVVWSRQAAPRVPQISR